MKHFFSTVSVALLLAGGLFAGTYSGGSGTSDNPYPVFGQDTELKTLHHGAGSTILLS